MGDPASITPAIVRSLYEDALLLADETRAAFDPGGVRARMNQRGGEAASVALSCEALRTTTRMMHAIAWLLNQKAYFAGEITEFQLRRHGRLPPPQGASDPAQLALLDEELVALVDCSRQFYARVARLDRAWRDHYAMQPPAVHRLRDRLGQALAG